jgi:7-carboxy-7-deazaguanine synthase
VKLYAISEIVYSLQPEGVNAGTASVFIRFGRTRKRAREAGLDRDGGLPVRDRLTADEVAKLARICSFRCDWAVLAGAEPALQADAVLVDALRAVGFRVAIETDGTAALKPAAFDWVKVAAVRGAQLQVGSADEIMYVIQHGDPIPLPPIPARHCFVSPAFDGNRLDPKDLQWCIRLVKENPGWRLSVQQPAGERLRS